MCVCVLEEVVNVIFVVTVGCWGMGGGNYRLWGREAVTDEYKGRWQAIDPIVGIHRRNTASSLLKAWIFSMTRRLTYLLCVRTIELDYVSLPSPGSVWKCLCKMSY